MDIEQVVQSGVDTLGYELVLIEYVSMGKAPVLRIFIDQPEGIALEDCEAVSRQISALMDVNDPIAGRYTLEVSSPGTDRPLVKPEHFERFVGERVKVVTKSFHLGRRKFTGTMSSADQTRIIIDLDNESYDIELSDIEKANLAPLWG